MQKETKLIDLMGILTKPYEYEFDETDYKK
jgi:hypothetical protein